MDPAKRGFKDFRWRPLGGLGEVGMNCMVFEFGDTVLPVDAGILFADTNDFGIESLHPDFTELLQKQRPEHWLITHAHEDHIGAVAAVLSQAEKLGVEPPEFLAPRFAAALIREKLTDEPRYPGASKWSHKIRTVDENEWLVLGGVGVRFISIRHSTADACSLAFRWQNARGETLQIIHTADFKLDEHAFEDGLIDVKAYQVFETPPDILFIDSTNAERPGRSISEKEILPGLEKLIRDQNGRVFVTLFSSNIYRISNLLAIAGRVGRKVCLAGRSLQTAHRLAGELGIYREGCPDTSGTTVVEPDGISVYPPEKQMIIASGSQGEYRSVLAKVAQGQHQSFALQSGDAVIFSSKMIPGNEKPISRLINGLLRQGAKVFWGDFGKSHAGGPIHASGHARSDEILAVMKLLKPRSIVPVHGELRQLMSCAEIGEVSGVPRSRIHVVENGTILEFQNKGEDWELSRRDNVELPPRILRFESFISGSRDPFLHVRKRAAQGGLVAVSVDSYGRCRVTLKGLLPEAVRGDAFDTRMTEEISGWMHRSLKKSGGGPSFKGRDGALEESLAEDLGRHLRRLLGVRPFVTLHLMED